MLARIDIGNLKSLRCVIAVANQSPYESRQRRRHGDSHRFSNRHSVRNRNIRQDSQRLSFFYAVTNADQAIDETCCFTVDDPLFAIAGNDPRYARIGRSPHE